MGITNKKIFHICMIVIMIVVILFIAGMILLRYHVEGETNLPFKIEKIAIVSNVEGENLEDTQNKWNLKVSQNNDIYLYIEKNNNYGKTEIIKNIKLSNFNIEKTNETGNKKIYKPSQETDVMFSNISEKEITEITFEGDLKSDIKNLKISNQGGIISFRYATDNIGTYTSNEVEEVDHSKLLKLIGISKEDVEAKISFNIEIKLESGKAYLATISLDIPTGDVVEDGTTHKEITNLEDIIFKRIEN